MGKEKNPRRVADNEAMAKLRMLRTSPQKLNLVAGLIRGKKVDKALNDLTFSKKRIAVDVKKCLQSAIANAENNHDLDVDALVVAEASVASLRSAGVGRVLVAGKAAELGDTTVDGEVRDGINIVDFLAELLDLLDTLGAPGATQAGADA